MSFFGRIANTVKSFISKSCPSFDVSRIFLSEKQKDAIFKNLVLNSTFLSKLGFPLNISESSIGQLDIHISPSSGENSLIQVKISDFDVKATPFDNILYSYENDLELFNIELNITNFRLTIVVDSFTDCLLITASGINAYFNRNKKGSLEVRDFSIFIGYEPIIENVTFNSIINYTDKSIFSAKIDIDSLKINMNSSQFISFIKLWNSFTTNNFTTNELELNVNELDAILGSGLYSKMVGIHLNLGNKFMITAEQLYLNVASVNFYIHELIYCKDKVQIRKADIINHHRIQIMQNNKYHNSNDSTINGNDCFLYGNFSQINVCEFTIKTDSSFLGFFLKSIRTNILFNFLFSHTNDEVSTKLINNSLTIELQNGPIIQFSLTTTFKTSCEKQIDINNLTIRTNDFKPIVEDAFLQIFLKDGKNDISKVNIYGSSFNIFISFDELKIIKRLIKGFLTHFDNKNQIYQFNYIIPESNITLCTKHGNDIEEVLKFNIKNITTKGNIEKIHVNQEDNSIKAIIKTELSPVMNISFYQPVQNNLISIINDIEFHIFINYDTQEHNASISISTEPSNEINSTIPIDLLSILLDSNSCLHDTNYPKQSIIMNKTTKTQRIYFENEHSSDESDCSEVKSIDIEPFDEICISDISKKRISFCESFPKFHFKSYFNGFKIDKSTSLIKEITNEKRIISLVSRNIIRNGLNIPIRIYSKDYKLLLELNPYETSIFNPNQINEVIIATDQICAKASDVLSIKEDISLYQIITNGVQKQCVIQRSDDIINILPYYIVHNKLNVPIYFRLTTGNVTYSSEEVKNYPEYVLLPYFKDIPIEIEVSIDSKKLYSKPAPIGQKIALNNQGSYLTSVFIYTEMHKSKSTKQIEIFIKPFLTVINDCSSSIQITTSTNNDFIITTKEEKQSNDAINQQFPIFQANNNYGIVLNSINDNTISIPELSDSISLQNSSGMMLIPLKTNSSLYYPVYSNYDENDGRITVYDGIIFDNSFNLNVTIIIDHIIFLEFKEKEKRCISMINKSATVSLSLGDDYEQVENVSLTMLQISTTIHFRSKDPNKRHIFANLQIFKPGQYNNSNSYYVILSNIHSNAHYIFINNSKFPISIVQSNYDNPLKTTPYSSSIFGFVSPFEKHFVTVKINDEKEYNILFTQYIKYIDYYSPTKDEDSPKSCGHQKSLNNPIYFATKSLENGAKCLIIGDDIHNNQILDLYDENTKSLYFHNKRKFSFNFSFCIPNLNIFLCKKKREIMSASVKQLAININTKTETRDFYVIQLVLKNLTIINHLTKERNFILFQTKNIDKNIITANLCFNSHICLSNLCYFALLLPEFTLRIDDKSLRKMKQILHFDKLKTIIGKCFLSIQQFTIHPLRLNLVYESNDNISKKRSIFFPSLALQQINGTYYDLFEFLYQIYTKKYSILEKFLMCKQTNQKCNERSDEIIYSNVFVGSLFTSYYDPSIISDISPVIEMNYTTYVTNEVSKASLSCVNIAKEDLDIYKEYIENDSKITKMPCPRQYKYGMIQYIPYIFDTLCKEKIFHTFKSLTGRRIIAIGKNSFYSVDLKTKIASIYHLGSTRLFSIKEEKVTLLVNHGNRVVIPFESNGEAERFYLLFSSLLQEQ